MTPVDAAPAPARPRDRTSLRRWLAALAVMLAGPGLLLTVVPATAEPQAAAPAWTTPSTVTVKGGTGPLEDFSNLSITVSQTRDLFSQAIEITWTGGRPTPADSGGQNVLSIMQCWGDPRAADDPLGLKFRETCQFGSGLTPPTFGGVNSIQDGGTRGILPGAQRDPAETQPEDALVVPFRPADGDAPTPNGSPSQPLPVPGELPSAVSTYFSAYNTNEIPYAITTGDGTGRVVFEVQTAREANHLGCGKRLPDNSIAPCWLVIVPRGEIDWTTGKPAGPGGVINGSPLTPGLWQSRIAVKLEFLPLDRFCPLGGAELGIAGSEFVADAVLSWQPELCKDNGPMFAYSQLPEFRTGEELVKRNGNTGLGFLQNPVERVEGDPEVLYAPVAISADTIGYNIDYDLPPGGAPPEVEKLRATQVREVNLTPRLVAKMLTFSYKRDVVGGQPAYLLTNPITPRQDKEFLKYNPAFEYYIESGVRWDGLMVPDKDSPANLAVWEWILADEEARAWLGGKPDEWGMVVNPAYPALFSAGAVVPADFPKLDQSTRLADNLSVPPNPSSLITTFNHRPYTPTRAEGARRVLRAYSQTQSIWVQSSASGDYKLDYTPPNPPGRRFAMGLTDAPSAARYGTFTARLRNRNGEFVAPDEAAVTKAYQAMTPNAAGMLELDPLKKTPGAYPLPVVTYAGANTAQSQERRRMYAQFLRYAVGEGQVPGTARGQLPAGYVPLPEAMKAKTREVALRLENWVEPAATTTAPPPAAATATTRPGGVTLTPNTGTRPSVPPSTSPGASIAPVGPLEYTAAEPVGSIRYAWLFALGAGIAFAMAGPVLLTIAKHRRRRSG
ncbi:hypothetical protein OHA72_25730 [Dactylosporangium sp. NBC_01737]|uniref:hypothetical protein n=1 Tax=Dactylosporangium sp. NBC_01737 TaxID=2975959 RepID=UPI002E0D6C86|nr:hypothetical protein OHA72_25730 [Dactylosporangium sp. NBC_01737]